MAHMEARMLRERLLSAGHPGVPSTAIPHNYAASVAHPSRMGGPYTETLIDNSYSGVPLDDETLMSIDGLHYGADLVV